MEEVIGGPKKNKPLNISNEKLFWEPWNSCNYIEEQIPS